VIFTVANTKGLVRIFKTNMSSVTDTTAVNAYSGHFDIFIPMESALHRASNDAINFVVF